jgi:hypothetical protein
MPECVLVAEPEYLKGERMAEASLANVRAFLAFLNGAKAARESSGKSFPPRRPRRSLPVRLER